MKKSIVVILFFLSFGFSFSQGESSQYALVAGKFKELYNNGSYNLVFQMFDADMKKALPREQTQAFLSRNVNEMMGNIVEMHFHKLRNGAHVYRTKFEKAVADISISLNAKNQINGLLITSPRPSEEFEILERNSTEMNLPFHDRWFVFWGGDSLKDNYHYAYDNQKFAYDFVQVFDGSTYRGNSKKNENYYAFGKSILAPCDAKVVLVIEGIEDNVPGEMNKENPTGNTVILKTTRNEFILLAHFKQHSILVKEGQYIKQGAVLGSCGNSGNSSEPHLHFSLQNTPDVNIAVGGKLYFNQLLVNDKVRRDYIPVKGDFVENYNNTN